MVFASDNSAQAALYGGNSVYYTTDQAAEDFSGTYWFRGLH